MDCQSMELAIANPKEGASMEKASMIGMDLAKNSFQLHGAGADGSVGFRKKLSRSKVLTFLGNQAPCVVAMEACGGAHDWGRRIQKLGHEVRLVPPAYVKPFVKLLLQPPVAQLTAGDAMQAAELSLGADEAVILLTKLAPSGRTLPRRP